MPARKPTRGERDDPEIKVWRVPPVLQEKRRQERQTKKPGNIPVARSRGRAREGRSVLQARLIQIHANRARPFRTRPITYLSVAGEFRERCAQCLCP